MKHIKSLNEIFGWGKKKKSEEIKDRPDDDIAQNLFKYVTSSKFEFSEDMFVNRPRGLGNLGSFCFEFDGLSIIVINNSLHHVDRSNAHVLVDNEKLDCSEHLLKEIYEYLYGKYSDVKKSTSTNKREEIRRKLSDL